MTAAIALARAELVMLARNRAAVVTALLVPLAGGLWMVSGSPADSPIGSVGGIAAVQLLGVVGLAVATTATTTLVARRQQRVLQRWRTAGAATSSVLAGTLAPAGTLLVGQSAILFTATAYAAGAAPTRPSLLALAIVLGGTVGGAAGFMTAALTRSVEAAAVTVIPAMGALMGGGIWVTTVAPEAITWPMRATGGGALVELVRIGWEGPAQGGGLAAQLAPATPSVLVLVGLSAVLTLGAARIFRWEARG